MTVTGKLGLAIIGILLFWPFEEVVETTIDYDAQPDTETAIHGDDGDAA